MTDTILLHLRSLSANDPVEAVYYSPASGPRALGRITLADAAMRASGKRVLAVLPATDVLALSLTLPDAATSKLRASLPFALEEQVACEIDTQHCALGPRLADGRWTVRVIARARLEAWLALLRTVGVEPQSMISAADGLREKPGDLMLWLDGDDAHWRAPGEGPLTLPTGGTGPDDAHDSLVPGLVAALGERAKGTLGVVVHADAADRSRYTAAVAALQAQIAPLQWQTLDEGALAAFAPEYAQGVNLLQAEFAPKRAAAEGLRGRWRWPLRLAAAAVLLQSAGHALEAWRLHQASVKTDAALLEAARDRRRFVKLGEGDYAQLSEALLDQLAPLAHLALPGKRLELTPGAAPLISVGSIVAVGQPIGLIEAMKLFNEIKSDKAGRVVRIIAQDGLLVKAKTPIIEVEPV